MTFLAPFSAPIPGDYRCCPHTQFLRWAWRSELGPPVCPAGILSTKLFPQPPNSSSREVLLPIQLLRNLGFRRAKEFDSQHTAGHRKSRLSPSSTWNLSSSPSSQPPPPPYPCSSDQAAPLTEPPGLPEQLTAHSGAPHTPGL